MTRSKRFLLVAGLVALGAIPVSAQTLPPNTVVVPPGVVQSAPAVVYNAPGNCPNCTGPVMAAPAPEVAEEPDEEVWRLIKGDFFGFKITGFAYGSGVYNATNGGGTRYNGPLTQNDQTGAYLNQLYLRIARDLKEDEFSLGATVDALYGNDYIATQSRGFEAARARGILPKWNNGQDYGLAIPQAYVEAGTTKTNIKVGHFYTPHGYMVVPANGNFFNTLPYGFMATNPFTHWGFLGNLGIGDNLSLMFGLVNGWDALDRPTNSVGYLGGIKWTLDDDLGFFSTNVYTGQEPENLGGGYSNRTLFTNIIDLNLTENFEFVLETNYGWQDNPGIKTSTFYNAVPYFFYKLNDSWKVGFRYEYFNDPGAFAAGIRVGNPNVGPYDGNFQSLVWGLNWRPGGSQNINIRPEIRYDWFNGTGRPFDAGTKDHQIFMMIGSYIQF